MDRDVRCFFYRLETPEQPNQGFEELIRAVAQIAPGAGRERLVSGATLLRLERLEEVGDFIFGDFTRKQTENLPSEIPPDGEAEALDLDEGAGLGHSTVFRYHRRQRILCVEKNRNGTSVRNIMQYLRHAGPSDIRYLPVLTADAFIKLQRSEPKRLVVRVAEPEHLEAIEDTSRSVFNTIGALKTSFGGAKITIDITVGREQTPLNRINVIRVIGDLINNYQEGTGRIDKIRAFAKEDDEEDTELLDFIKAHLQYSDKVDLAPNDPDIRFERKQGVLAAAFDANTEALRAQFG